MVLARVHLAEGSPQAALAVLDPAAVAAEAAGREGRLIEISTLQALAHAALRDQAAAHRALGRAVVLAAPEGYIRTFIDAGPAVEILLAELSWRITAHELESIISLRAAPSMSSTSEGSTRAAEEKALLEYIRRLRAAFARATPATQESVVRTAATGQGRQDTLHADRVETLKAGLLTARELAVLGALALGATNHEIAKKLFIVESTVKRHVTNIISKLNAQNRTHAVVTAITLGLIDPTIVPGGGPPEMHPEAC
jgi:LuxR family maltose regulon positive regulatory protein